ncbi:DUF4351 domain-containing protein [Tissierella creatinophila]|uniref:DUF4351 domain-containing protein n=1 Tax=Tissierella creatinophila DSM 6911 TaxID=1123403 RepID=A0A1U7M2K1_TISCR|nr:DUF4351 domain-containing protein [Tissierella creatinophila]OLS01544.1 hypothetical protein TICRE_25830 [Tissierella creatinophila DSM 6911]
MTTAERLIKEGIEKGMEKGEKEGKVVIAIKLLTKKFGILPSETKDRIKNLDIETLDVLIDGIFEYNSLDDIEKFI